jgi:hypothetical protein
MPDKPIWCGHLEQAVAELRALPYPWVDRAALERILGVGRRRAQQILEPCVRQRAGSNGVAEREELIAHLNALASGETVYYENRRRRRLGKAIARLDQEWKERPKVLVEAPAAIVNQELANLPAGVSLRPGEITVRFTTAEEALRKLLALAMAMGNDIDGFERMVSHP